MAAYYLIHQKFFQPQKRDGFLPNQRDLGIVEYMRELRREPFSPETVAGVRIIGVEELLIEADKSGSLDAISAQVHRLLASRANELAGLGKIVQVLFRGDVHSENDFWFDLGRRRISLRRIFGTPQLQNDRLGNEYYTVGFNLT